METFDLLTKYLEQKTSYKDITLNNYELNGSIVKITYSYNPDYEWDRSYISYENEMEVDLLDYISFIFSTKLK